MRGTLAERLVSLANVESFAIICLPICGRVNTAPHFLFLFVFHHVNKDFIFYRGEIFD